MYTGTMISDSVYPCDHGQREGRKIGTLITSRERIEVEYEFFVNVRRIYLTQIYGVLIYFRSN